MPQDFHGVMHEYKHGELHSGAKDGPKVKSRKQALAIAFSEDRKNGGSKGGKERPSMRALRDAK